MMRRGMCVHGGTLPGRCFIFSVGVEAGYNLLREFIVGRQADTPVRCGRHSLPLGSARVAVKLVLLTNVCLWGAGGTPWLFLSAANNNSCEVNGGA